MNRPLDDLNNRGKRLTLVQQQSLVGVKDPSEHARRQVKELDLTASKSKRSGKLLSSRLRLIGRK